LYRSGRQADALDVYTRTREVLDEALGLEPSVSLRSLHERVLRQDATLGAPQDMTPGSAAALTATAADPPAAGTTVALAMPTHQSRVDEDRSAPTNLPTVVRPLIGRDDQLEPSPSSSAAYDCSPSLVPAAPGRPPWPWPPSSARPRTIRTVPSACVWRR
jgi:hypothetical protein